MRVLLFFLSFYVSFCWKFRRTFEIINFGTDRYDDDVLFVVNTESLINSGMTLYNNCSDFVFVSTLGNSSTIYPAYVESGCRTTSTYFWITLDYLPTGNTSIFMFYGADVYHTYGEFVSMPGEYYSMYVADTCPASSGWSDVPEMTEHYLRAGDVHMNGGGANSHFHTKESQTTIDGVTYAKAEHKSVYDPTESSILVVYSNHSHDYHAQSNTVFNLPPFYSVSMCRSNSPRFSENHVAIYNDLGDATNPDYVVDANMANRLFCQRCQGFPSGTFGGVSSHDHFVVLDILSACEVGDEGCSVSVLISSPSSDSCVDDHSHPYENVTGSLHDSYPSSFFLKFMRKNVVSEDGSHTALIVMASQHPPKGWDRYNNSDANERLLRATTAGDSELETFSGGNMHTHSYSSAIQQSPRWAKVDNYNDDPPYSEPEHVHDIILSNLEEESIVPPFYDFKMYKRRTSLAVKETANEHLCHGIPWNNSDVCSGHGICVGPNNCSCTDNYVGTVCDSWGCFGITHKDPENVCSGHGECIEFNVCDCEPGYYGENVTTNMCESWNCSGLHYNDSLACSGVVRGLCVSPQNCSCNSGYSGTQCENWYCFADCYDHGNCTGVNNCECENGYYTPASFCSGWNCSMIPNDDPRVCNDQRGECIDIDNCLCGGGYYSEPPNLNCEDFDCDNEHYQSNITCSGHGVCDAPDICECLHGYYGIYCGEWNCSGIHRLDTENVCSGHGECIAWDLCKCEPDYYGDECENWDCFDLPMYDTFVCHGRGDCVAPPPSDICDCHQDNCGALSTCVWGPECGEIILSGTWELKYEISIPYIYYDVLTDVLAGTYDPTAHRISYLCSDLLLDTSILGTIVDTTACYFSTMEGKSTILTLELAPDHTFPYNPTSVITISLKPLSDRNEVAVVEIEKTFWECYDIPMYDLSVCNNLGICVASDNCMCSQESCDDSDLVCVYGIKCGEVISNGYWEDKFTVRIPYTYDDVLIDSLMVSYDELEQRAYYNCEDLFHDFSVIGSAESCFFSISDDGESTSLIIVLSADNNLPYDVTSPITFEIRPLSDRDEVADVEILKLFWECWEIPMYDTHTCFERGMCASTDTCVCDQSSCAPTMEKCVYGKKCGEVIWDGFWEKKKEIRIPYTYFEILEDDKLLLLDEELQRAYFKCSDLISEQLNLTNLGNIGEDEENEENCYFSIVEGVSKALHITIGKKKAKIVNETILVLNVLSDPAGQSVAVVKLLRQWKSYATIPVGLSVVGFVFPFIFLACCIVLIVLIIFGLKYILVRRVKEKEDRDVELAVKDAVGQSEELISEDQRKDGKKAKKDEESDEESDKEGKGEEEQYDPEAEEQYDPEAEEEQYDPEAEEEQYDPEAEEQAEEEEVKEDEKEEEEEEKKEEEENDESDEEDEEDDEDDGGDEPKDIFGDDDLGDSDSSDAELLGDDLVDV